MFIACDHRPNLVEQASLPTKTIVDRAPVGVIAPPRVRVLRRAAERPIEHGSARSAECLAILFDDDGQVVVRERLHRTWREPTARGARNDVTTECGLIREAVALIERPPQRRRIESNRKI